MLIAGIVPILCTPKQDNCFKLHESSVKAIELKSLEILDGRDQDVVIFGSCYSYFSVVKSIMIAHGLFSALAVASQKGNVCGSFQFDEDQRVLLLDYVLVSTLNFQERTYDTTR